MRSKETLLRLHRFKCEEKLRQAGEIELMITDFQRKGTELDLQIEMEEKRSGVSDPKHFSYSMTAKSIRDRKENLMRSLAGLKDQLARAQEALEDERSELRKIELMVEKQSGGRSPTVIPRTARAERSPIIS